MRTIRPRTVPLVPLGLAVALAACGAGEARPDAAAGDAPGRHPSAAPDPRPPVSASKGTCLAPAATPRPPGRIAAEATVAAHRAHLDRALARADASGHRFATVLEVQVAGAPTLHASLGGRRLADNTSSARLRWRGAASLLLANSQLRIVGDRIHARGTGTTDWVELGSASGIALDVGRELLDHPFLLHATGARHSGTATSVTFAADGAALRAYAGTERRGIATDLLVHARSLVITSHVRAGRLTGDEFRLVTVLPPNLPRPLRGRVATVAAQTAYCPLRPDDRAPITAPR